MARVVRRRWISDLSGPFRSDNRSCEYEAYIPDHLVGRAFSVDGEAIQLVRTDCQAVGRGLDVLVRPYARGHRVAMRRQLFDEKAPAGEKAGDVAGLRRIAAADRSPVHRPSRNGVRRSSAPAAAGCRRR